MSKHITTALATTVVWSVILAQAATVPPRASQTAKNEQRATTTPAGPPAPPSPSGGAVLCGNNPFCLPSHLRQPGITSGEAR